MTITLERVPVDRISERARAASFPKVLVAVITGLLFGLGWLAFKVVAVAWFALVYIASGVIEGWLAARAGQQVKRGPARAG